MEEKGEKEKKGRKMGIKEGKRERKMGERRKNKEKKKEKRILQRKYPHFDPLSPRYPQPPRTVKGPAV